MDRYCELRPNSVAKLCTDDPLWLLRVPTVKYLTTTTKRNMINEEAIQHFREFRGQHTSHRFCFTDGSKTEHHTGAAFMLNNEIHKDSSHISNLKFKTIKTEVRANAVKGKDEEKYPLKSIKNMKEEEDYEEEAEEEDEEGGGGGGEEEEEEGGGGGGEEEEEAEDRR
ncbi:hypothetical protein M8J75_001711 [Diaphorina citri]|nr:hypothetical protein M8J75_001711 [Diaphorina citri]